MCPRLSKNAWMSFKSPMLGSNIWRRRQTETQTSTSLLQFRKMLSKTYPNIVGGISWSESRTAEKSWTPPNFQSPKHSVDAIKHDPAAPSEILNFMGLEWSPHSYMKDLVSAIKHAPCWPIWPATTLHWHKALGQIVIHTARYFSWLTAQLKVTVFPLPLSH